MVLVLVDPTTVVFACTAAFTCTDVQCLFSYYAYYKRKPAKTDQTSRLTEKDTQTHRPCLLIWLICAVCCLLTANLLSLSCTLLLTHLATPISKAYSTLTNTQQQQLQYQQPRTSLMDVGCTMHGHEHRPQGVDRGPPNAPPMQN